MDYVHLAREFRKELDSIKKANRKLVKESSLTPDELLDMSNIYDAWERLPIGHPLKSGEYYRYQGDLYQVIEGKDHEKLANRLPTVESLFNKVVPEGVTPEWIQPTGAHNAYKVGDRVTYNGRLYESKIAGNSTIPDGDEPYNRYWDIVEK